MSEKRLGLWLIGARGGVAATVQLGLAALKRGLVAPVGLVSEQADFAPLELARWDEFVVGGHEIRRGTVVDAALRIVAESRALDPSVVEGCRADLEAADAEIRPGTVCGAGEAIAALADADLPRDETPRGAVRRIESDLSGFAKKHHLEHVVVVNVASTEPPPAVPAGGDGTWGDLESRLDDAAACPLPASSLYAIAALDQGFSYINFTPSLGSAPAAIGELARLRSTRHMGCDGKTGETLLKSVLAPMFARRNLQVLSWVGHNIFGNLDGKILDDPANKRSKVESKNHLVADILGYHPQTHVSIEYIESLGDWKTAWDHIHFAGFLGTRMKMQFIWEGCDSLLAAPLVLDLVRFTELAWRRAETGELRFLASFFKSPYGVDEQRFDVQYQMLLDWAAAAGRATDKAP